VLASSELTDMQPLLDDLRRETGVELVMDYRGTVEASTEAHNELIRTSGNQRHDLAWLSSDRYLQLTFTASRYQGPTPLSAKIMTSPLVVGMKPETAELLRRKAGNQRLSWADIADGAAAGQVRFGMADPNRSGSALAALVGVATAAAGTGRALRPEDVHCDRLQGFFTGQAVTAGTSSQLIEAFVAHQADTDALINDESVLLSLNASGRLKEQLEIIYPRDGIVLSDYPLLLLNPAQRDAYDRVVGWLESAPVQQRIM